MSKLMIHFIFYLVRNISLKLPITNKIFLLIESCRYRKLERLSLKSQKIKDLIENEITIVQNKYNNVYEIKKYDMNYDLKEKTILEIGPGNNLLLGFVFMLCGAKEVYLIDKFERFINNSFNLLLNKCYFKKYYNDHPYIKSGNITNLMDRINYLSDCPIENFNGFNKNNFDLIVSCAVLEHIIDLETTVKNMNKLLKKGGYMVHQIDLRDHLHITDKCYFDFLKYSPKFWLYLGDSTNRMRYSQYIQLIKKYNFEIMNIRTNKIESLSRLNEVKKYFHKNYRKYSNEELSIIGLNIISRKI